MKRLIVDFSYYCHYVIHSSFNDFSKEFDVPADQYELYKIDFTRYDEFLELLTRKFTYILDSVKKTHSITDTSPIFAMDCSKKDIWRLKIFPEYKIHRINKEEKGLNKSPVFKYLYENLLPRLEETHSAIIVSHPIAEGDDVVAVVKSVIRAMEPETDIILLATDHDFFQIVDDRTWMYNMQGELINNKMIGEGKDLLFKLLIGDDGDGVPKCFDKVAGDKIFSRGFGEVACKKLVEDPVLLEEKFQAFPRARQQMETNRVLVDFRNIPTEIKTQIARSFLTKIRSTSCK